VNFEIFLFIFIQQNEFFGAILKRIHRCRMGLVETVFLKLGCT